MTSDAAPRPTGHFPAVGVLVLVAAALILPFGVAQLVSTRADASAQSEWSQTILERVRSVAHAAPSPKVIFVGGSSLAFGLDAERLAARLEMPVVNFGLHAGIGIDLIVEGAVPLLGVGDLVVYAPEHFHFRRHWSPDTAMRRDWFLLNRSTIDDPTRHFPSRLWIGVRERSRRLRRMSEAACADALAAGLVRVGALPAPPRRRHTYDLANLDDLGQLRWPRPGPADEIQDESPTPHVPDYDAAGSRGALALRTLDAECRRRGAMLLAMAPIWSNRFPATWAVGDDYAGRVAACERLWLDAAVRTGARIVLGAGETTMSAAAVYDTSYHLNDRGVRILEDRLVVALRRVLAATTRVKP